MSQHSQPSVPDTQVLDLDTWSEGSLEEQAPNGDDFDEPVPNYSVKEIQDVLLMLESMQQQLPQNKYTQALREDIESAQVECTLIITTPTDTNDDDPEDTGSEHLKRRLRCVMSKYSEIKDLFDSIMAAPKRTVKRTPSDPPLADAAASGGHKYMRAISTDDLEESQGNHFE